MQKGTCKIKIKTKLWQSDILFYIMLTGMILNCYILWMNFILLLLFKLFHSIKNCVRKLNIFLLYIIYIINYFTLPTQHITQHIIGKEWLLNRITHYQTYSIALKYIAYILLIVFDVKLEQERISGNNNVEYTTQTLHKRNKIWKDVNLLEFAHIRKAWTDLVRYQRKHFDVASTILYDSNFCMHYVIHVAIFLRSNAHYVMALYLGKFDVHIHEIIMQHLSQEYINQDK